MPLIDQDLQAMQTLGLRIRSVTSNWFSIKKFADEFKPFTFVETSYLIEYSYVYVWIIKIRKQSPVGWFLESLQQTWAFNRMGVVLQYTPVRVLLWKDINSLLNSFSVSLSTT